MSPAWSNVTPHTALADELFGWHQHDVPGLMGIVEVGNNVALLGAYNVALRRWLYWWRLPTGRTCDAYRSGSVAVN